MSSMLHRHTRLLGFEAQVSPLWETHWKGRLVVVSAFKTSQEQPRHTGAAEMVANGVTGISPLVIAQKDLQD